MKMRKEKILTIKETVKPETRRYLEEQNRKSFERIDRVWGDRPCYDYSKKEMG